MTCEDQLGRYKVLIDTAHCFGRATDLKTLIDNILNRSQEVVRAEACSLLLPDAQTKELILYSTDPRIATLPQPLRVPPGAGIAGAVYQSKQKVKVNDAQNDRRHYRSIGQQVGFVAHAMLAIPLLDGMDCLGVMQALNPRGRDFFDEQDEEIFEGFGGLIAIALRRLEAERQKIELVRSTQELQVAREIQESFLPAPTQKFPFAHVHMNYFPVSAVGGDFCCVHRIGQHRLLLGLGDVTGKGIPAALTMARATAMIKATIDQIRTDLGEWVTGVEPPIRRGSSGGPVHWDDIHAGRCDGVHVASMRRRPISSVALQRPALGEFRIAEPFALGNFSRDHISRRDHAAQAGRFLASLLGWHSRGPQSRWRRFHPAGVSGKFAARPDSGRHSGSGCFRVERICSFRAPTR